MGGPQSVTADDSDNYVKYFLKKKPSIPAGFKSQRQLASIWQVLAGSYFFIQFY